MNDQNATAYFHKLAEVLNNFEITDGQGINFSLDDSVDKVVEMIKKAKTDNKRVMVIGNGGSAAIASHMQNDLCNAIGVKAFVFNEAPLFSALANDHGYGCVFERHIDLWAESGDILIAISSSGGSENIINGVRSAIRHGCTVITLSGFSSENPLRSLGAINFYAPSSSYGFVETAHGALAHLFTDAAII